jgi:hypothetical protein
MPSTLVRFRNSPDKAVDPEIHLKATAELTEQDFDASNESAPQDIGLAQEISGDKTAVELSLDGTLDSLSLDLRNMGSGRKIDRQKLLSLLLNSSGASATASSILLKPITSGLTKIFSGYTKTKLRVGSSVTKSGLTTSFQWRLNSRLELEGAAFVGSASDNATTSSSSLGLQDARFKLFLFDHLPVGRELFFEGIFYSPATQDRDIQNTQTLKLTYRLFEQ